MRNVLDTGICFRRSLYLQYERADATVYIANLRIPFGLIIDGAIKSAGQLVEQISYMATPSNVSMHVSGTTISMATDV